MWDCGSVRLDSLHWIPGTGRCAGLQSGGNTIIRCEDEFEQSSRAAAPPTLCHLHLGGFELQGELGLEALERLLGADRVPAVAAAAAHRAVGVRACSDAVTHCQLQTHSTGGHREAAELLLT